MRGRNSLALAFPLRAHISSLPLEAKRFCDGADKSSMQCVT